MDPPFARESFGSAERLLPRPARSTGAPAAARKLRLLSMLSSLPTSIDH
jgi:hypothetical protein